MLGRDEVRALERTQRQQVEDRAEVDVEALGALTSEHCFARRQRGHRGFGQRLVVGRRARTDAARRRRHSLGEHPATSTVTFVTE